MNRHFGRDVIEKLKEYYFAGGTFDGPAHMTVHGWLIRQGFKAQYLKLEAVRNWDRQARLELAEHNRIPVANPVVTTGFKRSQDRLTIMKSRISRLRDTGTRLRNDRIEAEADHGGHATARAAMLKLAENAQKAAQSLIDVA